MEKKRASETGIRMEIIQGPQEDAVAVDKLVDDLLHSKTSEVLNDLPEPHLEAHDGSPETA